MFMRYFYMGAGLCWLMANTKWPDVKVFQDWLEVFASAFQDATQGTCYTDIFSFLSAPHDSYKYDK